jgi:hypothetical protein
MYRTFKGSESRRRGVYHVACLSMKCYFKVSPLPPLDPRPIPVGLGDGSRNILRVETDIRLGNRIYVKTSYGQSPPILKRHQ